MRINLFALLVVLSGNLAIAQETDGTVAPKYSNEFLAIGVGADALGLSNAVVAQTSGVNSGRFAPVRRQAAAIRC